MAAPALADGVDVNVISDATKIDFGKAVLHTIICIFNIY